MRAACCMFAACWARGPGLFTLHSPPLHPPTRGASPALPPSLSPASPSSYPTAARERWLVTARPPGPARFTLVAVPAPPQGKSQDEAPRSQRKRTPCVPVPGGGSPRPVPAGQERHEARQGARVAPSAMAVTTGPRGGAGSAAPTPS